MPVDARTAKKLCTTDEFALYTAAARGALEKHDLRGLKALVARARKARNKWRDELKRQRREGRGKLQPRAARPAAEGRNTARKAELFEQTLKRLEARLEKLSAPKVVVSRGTKSASQPPKVLRRKAAGTRKGGNGKRNAPAPANAPKPAQPMPDKAAKVARAGVKRVLAHLSSRTRRSQARRDGRQG